MTADAMISSQGFKIDWTRLIALFTGVGLFLVIYYSPPWPDAVDPVGKHFVLSTQGKGAVAVFSVGGNMVGFRSGADRGYEPGHRRHAGPLHDSSGKGSLQRFHGPCGALHLRLPGDRSGIQQDGPYKAYGVQDARSCGREDHHHLPRCFPLDSPSHAHHGTHGSGRDGVSVAPGHLRPVRRGRQTDEIRERASSWEWPTCAEREALLLCSASARGIVALGFFKEMAGSEVSFFQLTYYMAPLGWMMVFLLWVYFCIVMKPEKPVIEGLRERVSELSKDLGPITRNEIISLAIVGAAIVIMSLQVMIPPLRALDKSAIFLVSTILFFVLRILDIDDLELIPWNIVLLFAGAMSIGYCLWQTGAAEWMAINWLALFQNAHWLVFVLGVAFFVLIMTNFIMNVAAIAISLPVALVTAKYLSVAPDVVMFASLATAGMPFVLLGGSCAQCHCV